MLFTEEKAETTDLLNRNSDNLNAIVRGLCDPI